MRRSQEAERAGQACKKWRVPESPFPTECSAAVIEEIRVAEMEALFSVPRGGAECFRALVAPRQAVSAQLSAISQSIAVDAC